MEARKWLQVASQLLVVLACSAQPLLAQRQPESAQRARATRESLREALAKFEDGARSQAYSAELREHARQQAAALRDRLQQGDFRPGDRVLLQVEAQPTLSDTFVVTSNRTLVLPTVGTVQMQGVLRSELEPHLREQIATFVRNPIITANSFIRVSVIGAVSRPGFHLVVPDSPVGEALMTLGGLTAQAEVSKIRVERSGQRILAGEPFQTRLRQGSTFEELGVVTGDEIVVESVAPSPLEFLRNVGLLTGFVFGLTRIF